MKKNDDKDFNISNTSDKSGDSSKKKQPAYKDDKSSKIDETTLSDLKIETTINSISHSSCSSSQEKLSDSTLNESTCHNKESSFITKYSSYIKSSFDPKHNYKCFHEKIISNPDIVEEIKDLYINYYSNIEKKLHNIRNLKKIKEAVKLKLAPNFWSTQDEESEKLTDILSLKIDALVKEKEAEKNSLIFLQSIILKDLEKIKDSADILNKFANEDIDYIDIANGDIDYINIANRNSDSYDILEFLRKDKYRQLISEGDTDKYNSLDSNEQLEFLKYLTLSTDNEFFANNVFSSSVNARVDIFNLF